MLAQMGFFWGGGRDVLPRLLEKFDRALHQRAGGWL